MTEHATGAVLRAVLGQIDWWWSALFRPRLKGLTDDEFLWQPAERGWTVHDAGDGHSRVDFHWPPPNPAPVTTIAWRLSHIGIGCLAARTALYYPDHAPEPWLFEPYAPVTSFPTTAKAAVAFVDRWWAGWRAGLEAAGESALWQPCGGVEADFPEMQLGRDDPFIGMVLHNHRELMHHGAEISLLRDLYLSRQPRDPYVAAVLDGDETALIALERDEPDITPRYRTERPDLPLRAAETGQTVPLKLLTDRGFDINALADGQTALHHLVAHGDLALVRAAIELGADPAIRDSRFHFDALGFADYFDNQEIADYLKQR